MTKYQTLHLIEHLFNQNTDDFTVAENLLKEKYKVNFEQFHSIVNDLVQYTHKSTSKQSGNERVGFVNHQKGYYIIVQDIK